ncbi:lysostaphin resistance A-like protein [Melittangium boletus]|uniref:CPBP family intramembrane glutamic endopeptidase n=1 Tax=Melittangium boletus TaxID=83453 RepID=UPI003DA4615A
MAVLATLGIFLVFVLAAPAQLLNLAFGVWFTQLFVFLGGGWFVLRATGREPARYTGLSQGTPRMAAFGFALGLANFAGIVAPLQYVAQKLLPKGWQDYDVAGLFTGQTPLELVLIGAGVGLFAPLCEEFFFRGVFFQGLKGRGGPPWRALVTSAVIFSAFHFDRMGFLARVELGLLFGWLLLRTGSLWPGVLAHAANNLVSLALFFGARSAAGEVPAAATDATSRGEGLGVVVLTVGGCAALMALVAAAERFPSLLGGPSRPEREREAAEPPVYLEPPTRLVRLAFPWMMAAVLSLAVYVGVDPLGVQLSQIDWDLKLKPVPENAPDALHAERNALHELRVRAHRGEAPLEEYARERLRQSRHPRDAKP